MIRHVPTAVLALVATLAGCGGGAPGQPRDRQAELTALRQDLFTHTFKGQSAVALDKTLAIARESKGILAADAWSQAGLARLDWALLALLGGQAGLLDRLARHLDLPASCVADGELATACLALAAEGVAGPFRRAAALYQDLADPSQADLASRRARLAEAAILHRVVESPVYFDALREGLRDKAYDLVRGSQLLLAASWLSRVPDLRSAGPVAAPALLLAAAPMPCPRAFLAWGRVPQAARDRALEDCRCAFPCPVQPPPPAGTPAPAAPTCTAPPLQSADQPYLNPVTYHVAQALKVLADPSEAMRENRLQGLQLRLSTLLRRFRTSLDELRVRVPYPPRLLLGAEPVVAPSWSGPAPAAWELTATVHVVATAAGTSVGLAPVLGIVGDEVALLDARAGLRLPGGAVPNRTRNLVQGALKQAREVGATQLGLDGRPGVVALYLDRTTTLGALAGWLALLAEAGERTVELVLAVEGAAAHAVDLSWHAAGPAPVGDRVRSLAKLDPATPVSAWLATELARPDLSLTQRLGFVMTP